MDKHLVFTTCNLQEGITPALLSLRYGVTPFQIIMFLNLDWLSCYASLVLFSYFSFTHRLITSRMIS